MRREGRPHGMVRTHVILPEPFNPRPDPRMFKHINTPPTAGSFIRVPSKPTNHSKFTGKCTCAGTPRGGTDCCHANPSTFKSRDKAKGTQKLKTRDVAYTHNLLAWRVVHDRPDKEVAGFSATEVLDWVSGDDYDCYY